MRRPTLAWVAAVFAVSACGGGPQSSEPPPVAESPVVYLRNLTFEPAHLTVETGATVEWVWDDGALKHDVSGDGFASELVAEGTFAHTFDEPGTYGYVCTIHPGMEGTVTVVATTS